MVDLVHLKRNVLTGYNVVYLLIVAVTCAVHKFAYVSTAYFVMNWVTESPFFVASQCGNGVKDNSETDQDCGGPCATGQKCADNKLCSVGSDCTINACSSERCGK